MIRKLPGVPNRIQLPMFQPVQQKVIPGQIPIRLGKPASKKIMFL